MHSTLITNIKCLVNVRETSHILHGSALAELPCLENAWLLIEGDEISGYGLMTDKSIPTTGKQQTIDASGRFVLPAWCDSHSHLVFAASREEEFIDKIKGLSYAEIAAKGGGILNSAKKLSETSEDELFNRAWQRLTEISEQGTGAIEIKSGYGLTVEGEIKMLRVIKKLKEKSSLHIRSTFLGAHTYPVAFKNDHDQYIHNIIDEMLPVIAAEQLADYMDVFCEDGFFSAAETEVLCRAGLQHGLKPKLHVNQLNSIGGIEAGLRLNALSLDHLETMPEKDIELLAQASCSGTWKGLCTLLPTAAFFLRMPYPPARKLIDAGCAIALATDYNPGSSPGGNMNFVVSLSCIQMKMLPEEAINAATLNGAYAMDYGHILGSITTGKKANLIFTQPIPSLAYLPYAFSSNCINRVMIGGEYIS
ncbi:MAG TPA: imidazolonepropionase [Agriterribacter sp.]|nr:imidazolonepropionase [Agriterribacter sp.]